MHRKIISQFRIDNYLNGYFSYFCLYNLHSRCEGFEDSPLCLNIGLEDVNDLMDDLKEVYENIFKFLCLIC